MAEEIVYYIFLFASSFGAFAHLFYISLLKQFLWTDAVLYLT